MITATLLSLFAEHTYPILFLWVFVQQMGCPLPSAPLLIAAGALCALNCGAWALTLGTVIAACLLADYLWFEVGRRYGRRLLGCLLQWSLMSPRSLLRASHKVKRYNRLVLLGAKFVPGMSTLTPPLSGHTGLNRSAFLCWDLGGSALWAVAWLAGGRILSRPLEALGQYARMEWSGNLRIVLFLAAAILAWRIAAYVSASVASRKRRDACQGTRGVFSFAKAVSSGQGS